MSALAALSFAFSGMALIGLSMDRHARQAGSANRPAWRPTGWLLLALSLVAALLAPNWRFALVEWVGALGAAAGTVVLVLLYKPRILPVLAILAPLFGLAAWVALS